MIAERQYGEAIEFCRFQLAGSPRCVTLRVLLARALLSQGSVPAAAAQLREVMRIDPSCAAAREMIAELQARAAAKLQAIVGEPVAPPAASLFDEDADRPTDVRRPRRTLPGPVPPPRPVAAERPRPVAVERPRPVAVEHARPVAVERPRPVAAEHARPVAVERPRPVAVEHARPVAVERARPVAVEDARPVAAERRPRAVEVVPLRPVIVERPRPVAVAPPRPTASVHAMPVAAGRASAAAAALAPPPPAAVFIDLDGPIPIAHDRPVAVAHDRPVAVARERQTSRRRQAFASPFVADEPKSASGAAARWQRPLRIEARPPQPLFRAALGLLAVAGLLALWQLGGKDAPSSSLPAAAVAAAASAHPSPEPPVVKKDSAPFDVLGTDVWIHPLQGPARRMPVRDSRLFGAERFGDRPSECRGGHCGIDLAGDYGEPVYAVHEGVVDRVQRDANPQHGGHYVRLTHRDGTIITQYFHLGEIPRRLEAGVTVKAGDIVGYVGLTGVRHSEPHLHFTISVQDPSGADGRYLDPEPLVALWPLRVSPKGEDRLRVATNTPPGLARGFIRRSHHRHHSHATDEESSSAE